METTMTQQSTFYKEMVDRNIGVVSAAEQERLKNACIAVAGCGGMGGYAAEQLVRLGVGHVKIADFDRFETHNLSRQCYSATSTVGKQKTAVLEQRLKDINPELRIDAFARGVTPENADQFVEGAQAVINGIDYNAFYSSVMLYRAARRKGLCVVDPMAVGWGATVFVFGPKTMTIEEYVGLPPTASKEEIERYTVPPQKFAPYFPSYTDLGLVRRVIAKEINIPNIVMPQCLGTAITVTEAVLLVLGKVRPPKGPKPRVFIIDLFDRKFKVTE